MTDRNLVTERTKESLYQELEGIRIVGRNEQIDLSELWAESMDECVKSARVFSVGKPT